MPTLMQIVADSLLGEFGCGPVYLQSYDPDGDGGRGAIKGTLDALKAMQFPSASEALECWRRQSTVVPLRTDGKPNRPLTAYTVTFVSLADALKATPVAGRA